MSDNKSGRLLPSVPSSGLIRSSWHNILGVYLRSGRLLRHVTNMAMQIYQSSILWYVVSGVYVLLIYKLFNLIKILAIEKKFIGGKEYARIISLFQHFSPMR